MINDTSHPKIAKKITKINLHSLFSSAISEAFYELEQIKTDKEATFSTKRKEQLCLLY